VSRVSVVSIVDAIMLFVSYAEGEHIYKIKPIKTVHEWVYPVGTSRFLLSIFRIQGC